MCDLDVLSSPENLRRAWRWIRSNPELDRASTGTNGRRRRLNPEDFPNSHIPLPTREVRERLRRVRSQLRLIRGIQEETVTEMEALLPSIFDRAFQGDL